VSRYASQRSGDSDCTKCQLRGTRCTQRSGHLLLNWLHWAVLKSRGPLCNKSHISMTSYAFSRFFVRRKRTRRFSISISQRVTGARVSMFHSESLASSLRPAAQLAVQPDAQSYVHILGRTCACLPQSGAYPANVSRSFSCFYFPQIHDIFSDFFGLSSTQVSLFKIPCYLLEGFEYPVRISLKQADYLCFLPPCGSSSGSTSAEGSRTVS
jgi:hypothetical protein